MKDDWFILWVFEEEKVIKVRLFGGYLLFVEYMCVVGLGKMEKYLDGGNDICKGMC